MLQHRVDTFRLLPTGMVHEGWWINHRDPGGYPLVMNYTFVGTLISPFHFSWCLCTLSVVVLSPYPEPYTSYLPTATAPLPDASIFNCFQACS